MPDSQPDPNKWDSRPVPDPTLLTTEALLREIKGLRELMEGRLDAINERLRTNRERAEVDHQSIVNLTIEKFAKVDQQFELVERQRVEQKNDTKAAVDAALTAQKEAVKEQTTASERAIAKSESGTTKQLEQLADNFKVANSGIITSIDDLKDRIRGVEGNRQGAFETRSESHAATGQSTAYVVAVVSGFGLLVSAASLIAYIATHH